jgi:hypothetical protein
MVMVGEASVGGRRNSASLGRIPSNAFPLAMPDTVRGDAVPSNADDLARELVARIVAAMH